MIYMKIQFSWRLYHNLHSKPIQIKVQRINAHVNGEEEEEEMKKTSTESEKKNHDAVFPPS